ncbi:hypothetical protein [Nitratireductor sp. XY-223]|uniref:hypothetical protein n=1 Tax=Nitratireductor sp. XY-223 TaxID=2561926 RepID=UPI001FEE593C|nr:hypothetical protein [Nitratireductor sp. XY-223]
MVSTNAEDSPLADTTIMRRRDFWTALFLIVVSAFFLYRTSLIPFFRADAAGVQGAWFNSAALVPLGIFSALLLLSFVLLAIAIRDGGATQLLRSKALGFTGGEAERLLCVALILCAYIFLLVPRVDFIACSALLITALIWGFHTGNPVARRLSTLLVLLPALYAGIAHFPRAEWTKPHDDDIATVAAFALLTAVMFAYERRRGPVSRVVRLTPVIAIIVPLLLVIAMAFGFRQNVPNRQGLLFSKIDYHYYVTLKPLWSSR